MQQNMKQDDSIFTMRGALMGFFAYIIVILLLYWVFK